MMRTERTRPETDPGGIVLRGEAAENIAGYVERFGEPPACFVGFHGEGPTLAPPACKNPAVMEVYGLWMCGAHGEEAANGALSEIAYDLDHELGRFTNPETRNLSPHLEAALRHAYGVLGEDVREACWRSDPLLLEAFPLDRGRADAESVAYAEDPDANGRGSHDPPFDSFMSDRMLIHRHMRLAFEEGASWLVELLEAERESVAAQAAYALALEREAGLPL